MKQKIKQTISNMAVIENHSYYISLLHLHDCTINIINIDDIAS